jgi:hypothetical protein
MITKVECSVLECNNCKKVFENNSGHSVFADEESAKEDANEIGWYMDRGENKHYCDECWQYDDNDNLIIKKLP